MFKRIQTYWNYYETALRRRPLFTKVCSAAAIGGIADFFAQQCTRRQEEELRFDNLRTISFVMFAGGWTGGIQAFLFDAYARISLPSRPATVACRVFAHQFLVVPILYFPSFFLTTELLRGGTLRGAVQRWELGWWPAAKANWCLWVPASTLQFAVVPVRHQIMFVSCIGFFWQTVLSVVSNDPSSFSETLVDPVFDLSGPGVDLAMLKTYLKNDGETITCSVDL